MPLTRPTAKPSASAGFTLLEVMVALAVLCVGMLGFAALAVGGLQGSRIAVEHTTATALLAGMAERVRANPAGAAAYIIAAGANVPAPSSDCSTPGQCTAAMLAAYDVYCWQRDAVAALPGALTSIVAATDAAGAPIRNLTLQWRQPGDGSAAAVSITVQP